MDVVSRRLGNVVLEPHGAVIAGSVGQWTLTYTVGEQGVDEGGTLKLAQRFASDWEVPQFDRPGDAAYTTVRTTGQATLVPRYSTKGHTRPWQRCIVIDVVDGNLAPGDEVVIVLGNRSGGSPGIRAQTFQESAHELRLLVDPTNANDPRPLPTSPRFPVIAGEAAALVCVVPTQAVIGVPAQVFVRGDDRWGNPALLPAEPRLSWEGPGRPAFDGDAVTFDAPAVGRVRVDAGGLTCRSNPIVVAASEQALKRYWGDLHAQSDATVGTGTEAEYLTFGRDIARLDFTSHQGNDFQMSDEDWRRLNRVVREYHADGSFVVFPGYEWSGNTPAGGDRNVFYLEEDQPILRSSHWLVPEVPEDERTPAHPASVLFERLRHEVGLEGVLVGSHVGGRYADIQRYFDQELGPLVEVASCWGVFEWILLDSLDLGHVVGVMCNSDGHKGRPGAEGPGAGQFGVHGGLTCVLAESLTRQGVFRALKERRCYGTTGPRIVLSFEVGGRPMGSVLTVGGPPRGPGIEGTEGREADDVVDAGVRLPVHASVVGTAPIESLTLFRGRVPVAEARPDAFRDIGASRRVRVGWRGARHRGRGRRVVWDGEIRVEGARILAAETFGFDAVSDGILQRAERSVTFRSRTTGDIDGIDLRLDRAASGRIIFDSPPGRCEVELSEMDAHGGRQAFDLGGLGIGVAIERYPEDPSAIELSMSHEIEPPDARAAYFVKATQADGHMAWSSPIFIELR